MNKAAWLMLMALPLFTCAASPGVLVGTELIPSIGYPGPGNTVSVAYLTVGWLGETEPFAFKTCLGLTNPLTPFSSWWGLSMDGLYSVTPTWKIGGGLSVWGLLDGWQFSNGTWATGITVVGDFKNIVTWLRFNFPLQVPANQVFLGFWLTFGLTAHIPVNLGE